MDTRQAIRSAEQAMQRAARAAHDDLGRGLTTLATMACIAPLAGVLGALCGIALDTFHSSGTEKSAALASAADGLARACLPSALGLLIGLQSLWARRYFRSRLEDIDFEMTGAFFGVANRLCRLSPQVQSSAGSQFCRGGGSGRKVIEVEVARGLPAPCRSKQRGCVRRGYGSGSESPQAGSVRVHLATFVGSSVAFCTPWRLSL